MSVDKNLFPYDLAVVTITKNSAPYIKEWLDYHLLAGVDHFFIYDNGSTDNYNEVIQPYIERGLLTDIKISKWLLGLPAYNAAIRDFKFACRYMAFIDDDEYIFPQNNRSITEVVDEVLVNVPNAAALVANWILYGSNNLEKADYNRGVLERFTARDKNVNRHIKTIANPRRLDYIFNPHFAIYFADNFAINEMGDEIIGSCNEPPTAEKIAINHYHTKSKEEYLQKIEMNRRAHYERDMKTFEDHDRNDIFDDGILKYRAERERLLVPNGDVLNTFAEAKRLDFDKLLGALSSNLLKGFVRDNAKNFFDNPKNRYEYFRVLTKFFEVGSKDFFANKAETFLTCLNLSAFLKKNYLDAELGSLFEEFSLYAVCQSFRAESSIADFQLLIKELPKVLALPYLVVNEVRGICLDLIPQYLDMYRTSNQVEWKDYVDMDNFLNVLKTFENYTHK